MTTPDPRTGDGRTDADGRRADDETGRYGSSDTGAVSAPPPPPPPGSAPPVAAPSPAPFGVRSPSPDDPGSGTSRQHSPTQPGLVLGVILVVIGGLILVSHLADLSLTTITWPLWLVVPGVAMLVGSFFIPPRGGVGLAIPGAMLAIVGLIVWVQQIYGLWATWAYAWALVAPTGVGLGMLLYGLVRRDGELAADGLRTTLVGIGLFLGFALFFEGVIGLSGQPIANLDQILPYAVIGLGILLVVLSFFGGGEHRRRRREERHRLRQERRAGR